ncbi:phosphatidylglycerophosphate synthase [Rhodoligotrophos appendicifer]|uniref:CDP-alcohol phosphatidyltransferase family protein n=1 Tax=Rhodoligotrophos appendicifer TaxID=987056 RepID=UPI0011848ED3|nr:CDP-alcohol phosphatidyltransferase family protein [Rhodoligotrophos appendicifer]
MPRQDQGSSPLRQTPVLCFVGDPGPPLFGLTLTERLTRQFGRAGITDIVVADALGAIRRPVIMVRADAVIDQPLIQLLVQRCDFVLLDGTDDAVPLAAHVNAEHVASAAFVLSRGNLHALPEALEADAPANLHIAFWSALRKRETPYAMLVAPDSARAVEWRMFMGTYKGATDIVTKFVWPRPAYWVTRAIAPFDITPNMVTTIAAMMTVAAFMLFLDGQFAWGLAAAWAMTFLDTVDGKLARLTMTSSKWGDIFDHGIDLIHPPFWYIAWGFGLSVSGHALSAPALTWTLVLIFGGYVLQRIMEGIAIKVLKLEIHIWRPIDTLFRQVTARRNPNLVLLTVSVLFGRPDIGLIAVAGWTMICLVLHGIQLVQALIARRSGPLTSWMRTPVPAR